MHGEGWGWFGVVHWTIWLLILVLLVFGLAALIKYLFGGGGK